MVVGCILVVVGFGCDHMLLLVVTTARCDVGLWPRFLLVLASFRCWFWHCMVVGCGLVVVGFGFGLIWLLVVAICCYWL